MDRPPPDQLYEPLPRAGHVTVEVGGQVYVCSGRYGSGRYHSPSLIDVFDPETGLWHQQPTTGEIPRAVSGCAYATIGSKLYVFGGFDAASWHNSLHELDLSTMVWRKLRPQNPSDGPQRKSLSGMVAYGEHSLVVCGGYIGGRKSTDELHVFNLKEAKCLLWTGRFAADGVGLMACVATEGFHSLVRYQWHRNGQELQGEVHPIIYVQLPGDYSCVVFGEGVNERRAFTVTGEPYNVQGVRCPIPESDVSRGVLPDVPKQYIEEVASVVDEHIEGSDEVHMLNVIGQGSFGTVYRGIWRGTIVAAKMIAVPSSSRRDAMREIEMCRNAQHPNILNLMGTVMNESNIILITNLVRGCDLHSLIFDDAHGKLSFTCKLYIAVQVCQATTFLHTSKPPTVHMDIKPANILVEQPSLHVYLADFGLAKILMTSGSYYVGSKTMKAGTPGFQAPEQLKGEKVDEKCDIYAFGCVLIELFGEHPVWPGLGAYQIMFQISKNNVPSCDGLPNGIEQLCRGCLSESEKRPNMIDILKSLIHLSGHK